MINHVFVLATATIVLFTPVVFADQPIIGFEQKLVDLPAEFPQGLKGYRVEKVNRGTRAARLDLERGDIIVYIDTFGFQSEQAFDWIMTQVGESAQIGIINVRDGKLKWLKCRFGHRRHDTPAPPGVVAVNFGAMGVVTIFNRTRDKLAYELRYQVNGNWTQWFPQEHKHPNRGWQNHTFPNAHAVEIRFDRYHWDGRFDEQTYNLEFNKRPGNSETGKDDGRPYYFERQGDRLEIKRQGW